ncbi:multidrug resistance efflux transporter family protein [Desulfovibrio mangrovi]|uniref:DMT family transporter n=1 Tax=Desulfovibrio mangrovi TaxID=2976983 RepID=UPI002245BFD2|nr:multidrug resistance efflux transporter family protein [Desulfovibrio mangrovi]UZP65974.1 multidrug resistance efflux transporter family protein [Desulfovibrio mangrovi]
MLRIVVTGILAALFFSSTFVLNRAMSLEGGHWVWTAALRYVWMLVLLAVWFVVTGKTALAANALRLFRRHCYFWMLAGSVGFGVFYALISFSASYAPGWVVAATWQMTILATPVVLLLFGRKVSLRALLFTLIVFAGVLCINLEQAGALPLHEVLLGALPVLGAAFVYPFGNQMVWEAREAAQSDSAVSEERTGVLAALRRRIPAMGGSGTDESVMQDAMCRVLLLTLGSLPFWVLLVAFCAPSLPSEGQIMKTLLVAAFSGVAATSLFLSARHMARSPSQLAAADSTQAMEVVFSLAGEAILLGGALPHALGWTGISLTLLGLVLYLKVQNA